MPWPGVGRESGRQFQLSDWIFDHPDAMKLANQELKQLKTVLPLHTTRLNSKRWFR